MKDDKKMMLYIGKDGRLSIRWPKETCPDDKTVELARELMQRYRFDHVG